MSQSTNQPEAPKKNNRFIIVLALLVIVGGTYGTVKYIHAQHHEETDDAQIEANISPVIPRVSGYIKSVLVKDNQQVKKGDTLLILDDRDLQLKVEQAEAALLAARSNMGMARASTAASQANIATSEANVYAIDAQIETAKVNVWRATQDFNRYSNLIKDHSITQQQFEQAQAQKQTAERQLQVLTEQKNAAKKQTASVVSQSEATSGQIQMAQATIAQREADVENAKLNLSYTVITAQKDGMVSKINVHEGQFLQTGQSLFSIVTNEKVWVVANFKETQLNKMLEGQKVTVHVDAFPGHDFNARVSSFSPATGARFALLPPDNSSGNFVKVVQRLPVKIEFTDTDDKALSQLRPGMNVDVDVHLN